MGFPETRMRRWRRTPGLRQMVRETRLSPADLVLPLFVRQGAAERRALDALPGHYQWPPDAVAKPAAEALSRGVPAVLLFGIPESKDAAGSAAREPTSAVAQAVRLLKRELPGLSVFADVCLCGYTNHGHCGVLRENRLGEPEVDNDATLPLLAQQARVYAEAGADGVAPSDMMDGRVGVIRRELDEAGLPDTLILAYSAKHASAFYGPFREAAGSAPQFGGRTPYQMDPPNAREALREIALDLAEGADAVMVKPALPCLDVLRRARERFDAPLAAYQVSGEYAMVHAAADRGWMDERSAALETLTAIKRAGADIIVTYWAAAAAAWLKET